MFLLLFYFLFFLAVVASICLTVPQIVKTLETKRVGGVSFLAFKFYWVGKALIVIGLLFSKKWLVVDSVIWVLTVAVLSITLCLLYKYGYHEKLQKIERGEQVLMFFPKFKPWIYASMMGLIYLIIFGVFIFANATNFYFESNIINYLMVIMIIICNLLFGLQVIKIVKTKTTDGLSFSFLVFGLAIKSVVVLLAAFLVITQAPGLGGINTVRLNEIPKLSSEDYWVMFSNATIEIIMFAILTITYLKYNKWEKKPLDGVLKSLTNSRPSDSNLQN